MKILITGGDGYIGSKLVSALEEKNYEVEVFDRPKDIRNAEELKKAIIGKDVVYHLAALAELSYTFFSEDLDSDIATNLLAGMMAATNSFQSPQVTPNTLELASQMIVKGAKREAIIDALYRTKNIQTLKNWGRVLSRLHKDKHIISSWLKHDEVGELPQDFQGLVKDLILTTPEAQVAIIYYQLELDKTEVWLYTTQNVDAMDLAKEWQAIGHSRFVKMTLNDNLDKTKERLLKNLSAKLEIINTDQ